MANALEFAGNLIITSSMRLVEAQQYLAASDLALLLLDCLEKREGAVGPISPQGKGESSDVILWVIWDLTSVWTRLHWCSVGVFQVCCQSKSLCW